MARCIDVLWCKRMHLLSDKKRHLMQGTALKDLPKGLKVFMLILRTLLFYSKLIVTSNS